MDLSFSCLFDEAKTVVIVPANYDIPNVQTVDPDTRIFIILVNPNGEIDREAEKLYKCKKNNAFVPVNILSRDIRNDTEIQMAFTHIEDKVLREQIYKKYRLFPHTLVEKLRSKQYRDEIETEEQKIYKSTALIESLLSDDWYRTWRDLPKGDLWPYFLMPSDQKRSFFYTSMTGLNSKREWRGLCPTLWPFLEMTIRGSTRTKQLRFKLLMFASWVRSASTFLATPEKKGLYSYKRGRYTGYSFEPSDQAINVLFNSLNIYTK